MPVLKQIGDDIWVVDHDLFTFGIHFPGRMTVARLADGGLWLHSPVPIDDGLAAQLAELGPVKHLVGPNKFHHLHLEAVKARYPEAKMWAAPGLEDKRKDLTFDGLLGDDAPDAWAGDIQQVSLSFMPSVGEVVFFHEKSATLIATDLFMNVHECRGLMSKMIYWLEGCYGQMNVPRLFRFLIKDRAQAAQVGARLIELQPHTVVMAHGRIVDEQASQVLTRALSAWSPTPALASGASA